MLQFANVWPKPALFGLAAAPLLYLSAIFVRFILQTRRPPGFPPGPPTRLGLGNLHQIPLEKPFIKWHEWSKTYGDIMGLKVGAKNFVILSNPTLMHEVFVKRGVRYGGRPHASIAVQRVLPPGGQYMHILFSQYDRFLKRWRGAYRHLLTQDAVMRQADLMSSMGDKLVHNLLHTPEQWRSYIQRWALEMPLLAIAGRRLEDYGPGFAEWYLANQHDWLDFLEPSNTPAVELCPWLKYLPPTFAAWKSRADRIRKSMGEMYFKTLDVAKEKTGGSEDSWDTLYSHLLRQRERPDKQAGFSDTELAFLGGGLLDAALDTTLSTLETMVMSLVGHEDAMRRAREEVDAICGDKIPDCDDAKDLSFALRWRSPTNVALPHLLTEDDVLEGYTIPKGTTVIANIYSIHLREEKYDRPDEFIPDRFLRSAPSSEEATSQRTRATMYSFSFGRRSCPGEDFARASIVTTVAKLLWAFDMTTQDGKLPDMSLETGFGSGVVSAPIGFRPKLTPRGAERARAAAEQFQHSDAFLSKWFS
ncbi:hypothetical protein AK830_g5095 [Neonectria ditissima]|uniref:Cytochrome P450 n=1 Tax=Neonectria ditissima TaxID=78410 RepID=A0A0P7BMI7_9HYPO|nr:hypothetical protein AK830_g5095 [Neonectria ditissima]